MAILLYLVGIYYAVFDPEEIIEGGKVIGYKIPKPLDIPTTSMGAILLTNFGAVLGISITSPNSVMANKILLGQIVKNSNPPTKTEKIQLLGVIVYLLTLIVCFIKWLVVEFDRDATIKLIVPFVEQYGKTLIAIVLAYATLVISEKTRSNALL